MREEHAGEFKNLNGKLLEYKTIIDGMRKAKEEQEKKWESHQETIVHLSRQIHNLSETLLEYKTIIDGMKKNQGEQERRIEELREESEARWQNNIEIMKEKERQFDRKLVTTHKSPSEKSSGSSHHSGDHQEELDDFFSTGIQKLPDEDIRKANPRSRISWPTTEEVIQAFTSFAGKKPNVVDRLAFLTGQDRTTRVKVEGKNMMK